MGSNILQHPDPESRGSRITDFLDLGTCLFDRLDIESAKLSLAKHDTLKCYEIASSGNSRKPSIETQYETQYRQNAISFYMANRY